MIGAKSGTAAAHRMGTTRMAGTGHKTVIVAIDQGTTSSRAIVFSPDMAVLAVAQQEFPQHFPASGWVEHDPEDIWTGVVTTVREALAKAGRTAAEVAGIGITNQRETVVVWDRASGKPIHRAIVWQDRRTSATCARLREEGHEALVQARTGLVIDPYFSGTKLAWILDEVPGARARAEAGELAFGTSTLPAWRLTGGATSPTDDDQCLAHHAFRHPGRGTRIAGGFACPAILPRCADAPRLSARDPACRRRDRHRGIAGDQQAATVGQACFRPA
jgi:glycerol kinase